jgi:2-polyprenyl-6-hydroxyphenyl methylase/3-demethylubiquinone-9 3-methyltransferase
MTIIASEVDRFNRLSATWWNPMGPMRPLHVVNELRFVYVCELIESQFPGRIRTALSNLRVLDVGCGAGLMCEPLARCGAHTTGIDAAEKNIAAARLHAAASGVTVDYRVGDPAVALGSGEQFDVVLALEVVEHVEDASAFIAAVARHLAPNGLLVVSTIDRTLKSFAFAIVGAEYVFRVLPRGTHSWRRFVRPTEMEAAAHRAGLHLANCRGMRYLPLLHRAWWVRDTSVNYIAAFTRDGSVSDRLRCLRAGRSRRLEIGPQPGAVASAAPPLRSGPWQLQIGRLGFIVSLFLIAWLPLGILDIVPFILDLPGESKVRVHAAAAIACLLLAAWGFWNRR